MISRSGGNAAHRLFWSVLDQGLSSASNFVLVFLLARGSAPTEFGLLMIGYAIVTLAVALSRSTFGAILGLDLPHSAAGDSARLLSNTLTGVLFTAVPVGAALAGYALLLPSTQDGRQALLCLACFLPVILVQDLQRFWAVAIGEPAHAAVSDLIWLVTSALGFLIPAVTTVATSATLGAAMWSLGAVAGSVALATLHYRVKPRFRGVIAWLRSDSRRRHLASDSLLSSASPLVTSSALAGLGGPSVVAAIRGAGTLFGPLNLLSATFPLALVPEALRAGPARARRMFLVAVLTFALVAVIWGVTLHSLPDGVGAVLLGETWPLVHGIVLITTAEYVGLGVWAVARSRFRVQNRLRLALYLRIGFTIATLVLPAAAVATWGTAQAAAVGLAVTSLVFAAVAWLLSSGHLIGMTSRSNDV